MPISPSQPRPRRATAASSFRALRRPRPRAFLIAAAIVVFLALPAAGARAQKIAEPEQAPETSTRTPLLRGPHPFLKRNAVTISGGATAAAGDAVGGLRVQGGYGYELIGSLWLDLGVGLVQGADEPTNQGVPCAGCGTSFDVMAGLAYRFQMNVPVIPYGRLVGGFVYVFPSPGEATLGLAMRPAIGARYYLFDWLGFGAEVGALLGFTNHDEASGLDTGYTALDVTVGAEYQF